MTLIRKMKASLVQVVRATVFPTFFILALFATVALCQGGNSISGHVFGANRRPLPDINVELLDDLSRTIARSRTNSSGRYSFFGLSAGRFRVRVLPFSPEYEEQEQDLEIVNFARTTSVGGARILGHSNEIRDFYLSRRQTMFGLSAPSTVFAQDVPPEAKKLYKQAIEHLDNKKLTEAYTALKSSIEIFPKYFVALETLGTEYVKVGHFEAAAILLSLAIDVNPRAHKSWYALARAYAGNRKEVEALAAAKKAIEINPLAPESLFLAGMLHRRAREYAEAEKYLTEAREASGDSMPDVHWELALLYAHGMKRFRDAAHELRLYLKARPDDKNAANIRKLIIEFEAKT
jgi:tetratricopeptide (TPR) repeat protein